MQIGSAGSVPGFAAAPQVSHAERAERGPDHDHDAADPIAATARPAVAAVSDGRGSAVNIKA